jgi:hypothetical protein
LDPPRCTRDPSCKPAECRQAFACGVLPSRGNGPRFVLGWAALFGVGVTLVMLIAFIPFYLLVREPGEPHPWVRLAAAVLLPGVVLGGIAGLIALIGSGMQRRHIRALAIAAQQTGLRFVGFIDVPTNPCAPAVPIIVPGTALREPPYRDEEVTVQVVMEGRLDGQLVRVLRYETFVDPMDYTAAGTAFKVAAAVVSPKLAFNRDSQKQWWGFLVATFPEPLPHVPDFLVAPARTPEGYLLERYAGGSVLAFPHDRRLPKYVVAAAEGSAAARWLLAGPLSRIAAAPGWSVQVVGGRLSVWRGVYYPTFRHTLPKDSEAIIDLIRFAADFRRAMVNQKLVP